MKGDAPGNIVFDGLLHRGNIPLTLIEELKTSSGTCTIIVITTGYYKHGSIKYFNSNTFKILNKNNTAHLLFGELLCTKYIHVTIILIKAMHSSYNNSWFAINPLRFRKQSFWQQCWRKTKSQFFVEILPRRLS